MTTSRFTALNVFALVTLGALIGMLLGAGFGYLAGLIGPDLFANLFPWKDFEPVGVAVVLGAFGGVLCGGGLATFGIIVQLFVTRQQNVHDTKM